MNTRNRTTTKSLKNLLCATFYVAVAACVLLSAENAKAATIVTDFSNFSESGNLLSGGNSREQSFTPSGADVTIASVSGGGAGQENYLSGEFSAFAVGDRVSVDWDGTDSAAQFEQFGLQIGSDNSGANLLRWLWRPVDPGPVSRLYLYRGATQETFNYTTAPDTLFLEKTATGWAAGSITGALETIHNAGFVNSDDGSTLGLYSDMRGANTKTLSNLTVPGAVVPEPSTFILAAVGLLGLIGFRRRRNR